MKNISSTFNWRDKPSTFSSDKSFTWNAPTPKTLEPKFSGITLPNTAVTGGVSINTEAVDRAKRPKQKARAL